MKKKRSAIIICNGEVLPKKAMRPLLNGKPFIVCADGGANKARKLGIRPDVIIGDLDSISPATKRYYSRVKTIRVPSQYSTDLEKALDYLVENRYQDAVVVGATGGRPDHSLSNLSILKKYCERIRLVFSDPLCDIHLIGRKIIFDSPIGAIISLLPLGRCGGITTKGLKYPLRNEPLELGVREGTSNAVVSSPVSITVQHGSLLLFIVKNKQPLSHR
ncbi:MAG TPA: thiamine diphosphokinase [Bacteroidota bacterium]|nr:thiamine diphosphokinase [Bacteroidota bacterium]